MKLRLRDRFNANARWLPRTWAPLFLLIFAAIGGVATLFFFKWLHGLSTTITTNSVAADAYVQGLKQHTQAIFPFIAIPLAGLLLLHFISRKKRGQPGEYVKAQHHDHQGWPLRGEERGESSSERHGLAQYVDPREQRLLDETLAPLTNIT